MKLPDFKHHEIRNATICNDGFKVSIQASEYHYCTPRESGLDDEKYNSFELGYPSEADELITEYAEDMDKPTETVYGYVPAKVVEALIAKHGGINYAASNK